MNDERTSAQRQWPEKGSFEKASDDLPCNPKATTSRITRQTALGVSALLAVVILSLTFGFPTSLTSYLHHHPLSDTERCGHKALLRDDLVRSLEALRVKWDVPGFVVAMAASPIYRGKEWTERVYGFGIANTTGSPVSPGTMWGIASNSKLFVALSIGLLIDRKVEIPGSHGVVLSYETKVKDVLDWWELADPYAQDQLTILDLLSMRSGLPSHDFYHAHVQPRQGLPLLRHLRPSAEIRETFQYCNQHYFTLAEIVSTVSNMTLPDFVYANILEPLNMTGTMYNNTEAALTGNRAEAFLHHGMDWQACRTWKGTGPVPEGCLGKKAGFGWWTDTDAVTEAGAGSMVMSGRDMRKWVRELLDPQHLPPHIVSRCTTPVTVMPPFMRSAAFGGDDETSVWAYGLAQMRFTYRGQTVYMHTGGLPGSYSILIRLPQLGVGMMVAVNDDLVGPAFFRVVALTIVDSLLDRRADVHRWEGVLMPAVWESSGGVTPPGQPTPPVPVELGLYRNPAYGDISFLPADDPAILTALHGLKESVPINKYTQVARVDKAFVNVLAFTHFDGQLWNWTTLIMYDTPAGRLPSANTGTGSAIVTDEGIGMFGNYWIAGQGVPVRHADRASREEDAEVWYDRVH